MTASPPPADALHTQDCIDAFYSDGGQSGCICGADTAPPADALREAAWNLADSLLVNDFTHSVSGGVAAHYWREKVLAALAAAPAPGLTASPDALRRAIDRWGTAIFEAAGDQGLSAFEDDLAALAATPAPVHRMRDDASLRCEVDGEVWPCAAAKAAAAPAPGLDVKRLALAFDNLHLELVYVGPGYMLDPLPDLIAAEYARLAGQAEALAAAPAPGLDDQKRDIESIRKALKIGAISYDGDPWYAASGDGGAGLGYDECEAALKEGFAALARLADQEGGE